MHLKLLGQTLSWQQGCLSSEIFYIKFKQSLNISISAPTPFMWRLQATLNVCVGVCLCGLTAQWEHWLCSESRGTHQSFSCGRVQRWSLWILMHANRFTNSFVPADSQITLRAPCFCINYWLFIVVWWLCYCWLYNILPFGVNKAACFHSVHSLCLKSVPHQVVKLHDI